MDKEQEEILAEEAATETGANGKKPAPGVKKYFAFLNPFYFIKCLLRHKLWFFIACSILLLILTGAWLFLFNNHSSNEVAFNSHDYADSYYALPTIKLKMRHDDNTTGYVVIGLTLKTHPNLTSEELKKLEPEILDMIHTYLASITLDSFSNTKIKGFTSGVALERLRLSILKRINTITAPRKIENVLFRKLITQ